MMDLIERQVVIDALKDWYDGMIISSFRGVEKVIKALPSAQPDIVLCKDCKKHNVSVGYQKDCCPLYEFRGMTYGHEHDYQYCCFAERRTDGVDN